MRLLPAFQGSTRIVDCEGVCVTVA